MDRRSWLKSVTTAAAGPFVAPFLPALPGESVSEKHADGPIRMHYNENPYGPSPKVFEHHMDFSAEYSRYFVPAFNDLKDLAAEKMGVKSEQCVVMNGSIEVLKTVSLLAQRRGGTIISPQPTYGNGITYAAHLGATVQWIPLDSELQTDLQAMADAVNADTGMVFVCNPANPTGLHIPHDTMLDFVKGMPRDVLVFVDEAYAELATASDYRSMVPYLDEFPNLIVSRTMSKAYGMAGYRIGYGLANAELATTLNALRTTYVTIVGAHAALIALQDREWFDFCAKNNEHERERVTAFLRQRGVRVLDSQTNFVFYQTGMDAAAYAALFEPHGFILGRPFAPLNDWCRLSLSTAENMDKFMAAYDGIVGG